MRLPRLLRTASLRLAALYLLLFTASAVVLGAVVFWTTRAALDGQARARIQAEVASLRDEYQAGGLPRLIAAVEARGRGAGALDYLVQGAEGRRLAGEIAPLGQRRGWLRLDAAETDDGRGEHELVRALAVPFGEGIVVAVGDDFERIAEAEEAILRAFAWAIGLTLLLGVGGGAWLSHLFLRRVDAIGRVAEAIIEGDLARRVPVRGTGDDLDRLAATLNRMLDRIAILMESLRQVSNDIAHDLRTPLSRLGQRLEDARAHARSVADYERAVEGAAAEAEALLGTFAALLRIAEVEAGAQRAAFRWVDLSRLAETVADAFAPVAEDEGRALRAEIAPGVTVHGDQELLTQMLANLVENALRHTPPGSRVRVLLAEQASGDPASGPVLSVEDNGTGIPENERGRVLRRFHRLEQSRTTPGSGLGLSLVAAVAELHGARLGLEDAGPGLRVSLAFPAGHPGAVLSSANDA
ncbi:MAG TPA: HAMP domain-containing sensor histidine kinase [Acetobacteraceae bacterium]|nr:HAMP domain-containing sensor histidine kinase [Acetobacteraceae bacterium]